MSALDTSHLLQFLFLVLLTVLACSKVTLQGRVSRKYIRNTQDSVLYNALFFVAVALMQSLILPLAKPSGDVTLLATLSGLSTLTFQVVYSVALTTGPISLTVLLVNFNILIPTVMSVILFREKLYYAQLLGIVFLIISMILNVNKTEGEKKGNTQWLLLTLIALLAGGADNCIQKIFYLADGSKVINAANTYLVLRYIVSAILAFVLYFMGLHTGKKEKSSYWFNKNVLFYAVGIGAIIAVFQKLYMVGIEHIDGTFMFPTYTGLQSVSMTAIGVVLFKDRLSRRQWLGVLSGIISVALMNLKIGAYLAF